MESRHLQAPVATLQQRGEFCSVIRKSFTNALHLVFLFLDIWVLVLSHKIALFLGTFFSHFESHCCGILPLCSSSAF